MSLLAVYTKLYLDCAVRAVHGIRRSPWTLLLPIALWASVLVLAPLLGQLGIVGGFLYALALDALFSSYLYFVSEITRDAKVDLSELKKSFGAYFWAVLNLFFIIWLVELVLGLVLARNPQAGSLFFIIGLLAFVLLNAAPETIYQRGTHGGIATIQYSVGFIHRSWIEWFIPNLLFGAAFYYGVPLLLRLDVPLAVVAVLAGALLHVIMVFRGHLFYELDNSSHRQRMFRYRTAR